jgi:hypothetical protein
VSRRLQSDGRELQEKLTAVEEMYRSDKLSDHLGAVKGHVALCLNLERQWRRFEGHASGEALPQGCLQALYRRDLLVHHNWSAPGAELMQGSVEAHSSVFDLSEYYSPWYISREDGGLLDVDYTGTPRAPHILQQDEPQLPAWPKPIQHKQVLGTGFRSRSIAHMREVLKMSSPRGMALLAYELPDGRRLILDGNHRLAAALQLARDGKWHIPDLLPPLVVVFVLHEMSGHPPQGESQRRTSSGALQQWTGFNPDVELLRRAPRKV